MPPTTGSSRYELTRCDRCDPSVSYARKQQGVQHTLTIHQQNQSDDLLCLPFALSALCSLNLFIGRILQLIRHVISYLAAVWGCVLEAVAVVVSCGAA